MNVFSFDPSLSGTSAGAVTVCGDAMVFEAALANGKAFGRRWFDLQSLR